ncbi:MAG TPA: NUDIX domain-containing protein, partial [Pirellulales bacterium]|nr:NUDIX domain-containing protein [Pirellulales bacterium]
AGAILSIAYDARAPILEANTVRLLSRLLAYRGDPRQTAGQSLLWSLAEELLPRRATGEFNQALMELGALVCKPRDANCGECPVRSLCPTHRLGWQRLVPMAKAPPRVEQVREAAVVVRRRGKVLLVERQPGERWAGLWDFPRFPFDGEGAGALIDGVAAAAGVICRPLQLLKTLKHSVTRFRITLDCHLADYVRLAPKRRADLPKASWAPLDELESYPLSVTGRKLARLVARR